jgi:hypothetical protein
MRLNFVGLKPHAPSVITREKILYTIARNALGTVGILW